MAAETTPVKDSTAQAQPEIHGDAPPIKRSFWQTINPGYIVAGLATLANSWISINTNFIKNIIEEGSYKGFETDRNNAKAAARTSSVSLTDRKKLIKTADDTYLTSLNQAIKDDTGATNTFKRFLELKPHQQKKIGLTFATVAAIAFGAVYSFSRESKLANSLHRQIAENAEQNNQQAAR